MWDDLGQAEVVDIRALPKRGGHFYLPRRSEDRPKGVRAPGCGSVRVRDYLSKTLRDLQRLADMSPAEVEEAADRTREGAGGDLWKLALYWATGLRFWSGSPEFTLDETEDDGFPHIPCYTYVGTARIEEFPGHALRNSVILSRGGPPRPPPDATDSPGTGDPS
jgi:hypothetical protein